MTILTKYGQNSICGYESQLKCCQKKKKKKKKETGAIHDRSVTKSWQVITKQHKIQNKITVKMKILRKSCIHTVVKFHSRGVAASWLDLQLTFFKDVYR